MHLGRNEMMHTNNLVNEKYTRGGVRFLIWILRSGWRVDVSECKIMRRETKLSRPTPIYYPPRFPSLVISISRTEFHERYFIQAKTGCFLPVPPSSFFLLLIIHTRREKVGDEDFACFGVSAQIQFSLQHEWSQANRCFNFSQINLSFSEGYASYGS